MGKRNPSSVLLPSIPLPPCPLLSGHKYGLHKTKPQPRLWPVWCPAPWDSQKDGCGAQLLGFVWGLSPSIYNT